MGTSPFLTDAEILSIARPLVQSAAITRWFKQNGFSDVKRRPGGLPLISRSYFDAVTTSGMRKKIIGDGAEIQTQPNVDAFQAKYGKPAKPRLLK